MEPSHWLSEFVRAAQGQSDQSDARTALCLIDEALARLDAAAGVVPDLRIVAAGLDVALAMSGLESADPRALDRVVVVDLAPPPEGTEHAIAEIATALGEVAARLAVPAPGGQPSGVWVAANARALAFVRSAEAHLRRPS